MSDQFLLIKRTRTGIHGEGLTKDGSFTCSTGSREFEREIERCAEGCAVLDLLPIDRHPKFTRFVLEAPLVTFTPRRSVNVADVSPTLVNALCVPGNDFGTVLAGAIAGVVSLDYAPLDHYLGYWRSRGAKVGRVVGGQISWDA